MRYKHIDTHFKPDEEELYQFVKQSSRGNFGYLIKEAIKAYRYLLEKYGSDWKDKI